MGKLRQREHGELIIINPEIDKTISLPTYQCVHCGDHWVKQSGSGKTRGFCMNCNGPVCSKKCEVCIPFEKQLEAREAGQNWGENLSGNPVSVSIPKLWLPE